MVATWEGRDMCVQLRKCISRLMQSSQVINASETSDVHAAHAGTVSSMRGVSRSCIEHTHMRAIHPRDKRVCRA